MNTERFRVPGPAGLGCCWGQLLAAVTVKACSPGTPAAGLEHSKTGDVALLNEDGHQ